MEEAAYLVLADRLKGVDVEGAKEPQCVDLAMVPQGAVRQ
jgi:hypothetical protein